MRYTGTHLATQGIPTVSVRDGQEGDAVFCHSGGVVGRSIRVGQYLKHYPKDDRYYNHIAWLDNPVKDKQGNVTDWYVGQAVAHGVTHTALLSEVSLKNGQPYGDHEIVPLSAFPTIIPRIGINREILLETLRQQIGLEYGFLTIGSEVVNILSPSFLDIDFRKDKTWICSALYSYGLLSAGGYVSGDVYQIFPAQVAQMANR
jgi:hypothetical protein